MITNKKPRGRPFQKGEDARRNLSGGSSPKAKQDFKAEFKRIFEEEVNIRKIIRQLLRKAEAGQPWAISEVLDRGLGKPTQSIGLKDETPREFRVVYDRNAARELPEADQAILLAAGGLHDAITVVPEAPDSAPEKTPADLTDEELDREIGLLSAEGGHETS